MIKAAFFDVDGTLVSHTTNTIPQSTQDTIARMKKNGILCALATGRSMLELPMLPQGENEMDGFVTLNGQLILDKDSNVIAAHPISGQAKEGLLALFSEKETPILLVEKDRMYINFINDIVVEAQAKIHTPLPKIAEYSGDDVYLAIGFISREEQDDLQRKLPGCLITRWGEHAVDIISDTGGKQVGIEEYLAHMNISDEETIAFGDGENDLEMIRHAGIGVAMGNAEEMVKAVADYVTDDVDHDGIRNAALHFGLI